MPSPSGALVTTIRCFRCRAEQTVIGPSTFPTFEYPGWQVEQAQFYNPAGRHFCPEHSRRTHIAYCEEIVDCEACLGLSRPFIVNVPVTMSETTVITALNDQGVTCHGGHKFLSLDVVEQEDITDADVVL